MGGDPRRTRPMTEQTSIESISTESRRFPPPADFAATAHINSWADYQKLHTRSLEDPDGFWAEVASDFHFYKKWTRVLQWDPPFAKWFIGGQTNISYNCLDLQIEQIGRAHV